MGLHFNFGILMLFAQHQQTARQRVRKKGYHETQNDRVLGYKEEICVYNQ